MIRSLLLTFLTLQIFEGTISNVDTEIRLDLACGKGRYWSWPPTLQVAQLLWTGKFWYEHALDWQVDDSASWLRPFQRLLSSKPVSHWLVLACLKVSLEVWSRVRMPIQVVVTGCFLWQDDCGLTLVCSQARSPSQFYSNWLFKLTSIHLWVKSRKKREQSIDLPLMI